MRYKYVVPVYINHEKNIVSLERFDERIININLDDIISCEFMA